MTENILIYTGVKEFSSDSWQILYSFEWPAFYFGGTCSHINWFLVLLPLIYRIPASGAFRKEIFISVALSGFYRKKMTKNDIKFPTNSTILALDVFLKKILCDPEYYRFFFLGFYH